MKPTNSQPTEPLKMPPDVQETSENSVAAEPEVPSDVPLPSVEPTPAPTPTQEPPVQPEEKALPPQDQNAQDQEPPPKKTPVLPSKIHKIPHTELENMLGGPRVSAQGAKIKNDRRLYRNL